MSLVLLALFAAEPQALAPVSKWAVEGQPGLCQLTRTFADKDRRVTLVLRQAPADYQTEVTLISPDGAGGGARRGKMVMTVSPGDRTITADAVSMAVPGASQRLLRFMLGQPDAVTMVAADRLTFQFDAQPPVALKVSGIDRALAELGRCEGEQLSGWGVEPVATLPQPIGDMADWFVFPLQSRVNQQTGDTTIRWIIGETGRATDCVVLRSSGVSALDREACSAVLRRARYVPAKGADGLPRKWIQSRRLIWQLE